MSVASRRLVAPLAAALLFGCSDGPNEPQQLEPARIALSATFAEAAGGTVEAYTKSNVLWLRFSQSGTVVVEELIDFDGTAAEVHVPIEVPLRQTTETLRLELELRRDTDAIFRGTANVALTAGRTAEVELPLQPVIASVNCTGPEVVLDAFGATAQLQAVALFATGDTIPSPTFAWSAGGATAITVAAATGLVTARADGTVTVTCAAGGATSTRNIRVFAVVTAVAVAPPTPTIFVGATQSFTATLRDRLNNVITGRSVSWTSQRPTVASMNTTGTATGLTNDTTRIVATVGAASGSALLTVVHRPPVATTTGSSGIAGSAATVNGTVNPMGAATTAWFEYGTSPTLATSTATPAQSLGSGSAVVAVSADLANLGPNTVYYFRTVASSAGGTVRGTILSFTTLAPPTVTTTGSVVTGGASALLSGTANPNGLATTMWFEYGTSPTLATFATSLQRAIGSGTAPVAMDTSVTGLTPGTLYYFRAVASNSAGTERGAILSFTTESGPIVTTLDATLVSGNSAVLRGTINPNGTRTASYWFEYGTSPTLATFTATTVNGVGSGTSTIPFNETVDSLQPGTTYYFRAVGQNAIDVSRGAILSFTTLSLGPPTVTTVRAYFNPDPESVNPVIAEGIANPNGLATEVYFEFSFEDSTMTADYFATGGTDCIDSAVCSVYDTTTVIIPAGRWQDTTFSEGIYDVPCAALSGTWVRAVATNALGTARGNIFFLPDRQCMQFRITPGVRSPSAPTRTPPAVGRAIAGVASARRREREP